MTDTTKTPKKPISGFAIFVWLIIFWPIAVCLLLVNVNRAPTQKTRPS